MNIAIVTDSTAYISEDIRRENDIYLLPLQVQLNGKYYREELDITAEEFYDQMREAEEFPTSSQPAIGETMELFEHLSKKYDAIISIHLSSGISGTYESVCTLKDEFPTCDIFVYDSEISCYPQARFVLEAARLAKKNIEAEQIIERLDQLKERSKAYFLVDDLKNLQKGGRLSESAALVGSLLRIKPILHFEDKKIVVFEKIRTRKKAIAKLEKLLEDALKEVDYPLIATVIHANTEEVAQAWMEEMKANYSDIRFELSYFGPVIGTHLGERALGLTWTEDVERNQPTLDTI